MSRLGTGEYSYRYQLQNFVSKRHTYSTKIGRAVLGRELATIHDYRQRYGQYRTDVSLLDAHQSFPWFNVWDDHEVRALV